MTPKTRKPYKTYSAVVDGNRLTFSVKRGSAKNRLTLTVRPTTGLTVFVPPSFSINRIPDFLREKIDWILEKLKAVEKQMTPKTVTIKEGDAIPYIGQHLKVVVHRNENAPEGALSQGGKFLINVYSKESHINAIIENWYQNEAKKIFTDKLATFSSVMGLEYNRIIIRANKSRWGSCSPKKTISLNWRLIKAPPQIIDYVIIHELAHLKEMNHSDRFWALVSHYCTNWRQHRKWLKDHGKELFQII